MMKKMEELRKTLAHIDGRGYSSYAEIEGVYEGPSHVLCIDRVQGDPFAPPSRLRIRVPQAQAGFPEALFNTRIRRMALEDLIARQIRRTLKAVVQRSETDTRGRGISIDGGGQEVLERTACKVGKDWVEARLEVGLPAEGRTILGREARSIFFEVLPDLVLKAMHWRHYEREKALAFVSCIENQEAIRAALEARGLVAFVADGSILPRESGESPFPLASQKAVRFKAPDALRVEMEIPNPIPIEGRDRQTLSGMGIPKGVTLIVGGGYHGKSTLLRALEQGVYPHIPGDGREYVVTRGDAVKIRAEDGRRIEAVDLSPFIENLPLGADTRSFSTDNASGSTSQAANILEALEAGAGVLLLDEDTSATNFMVRDQRVQALVPKSVEPITPFLDRVRELYEGLGISTVLVMGGCGDYFDVADTVIFMEAYAPRDRTAKAREVAAAFPTGRKKECAPHPFWRLARTPDSRSIDPSRGRKAVKMDARGLDQVLFGDVPVLLRGVEQLVDPSQTRTLGPAILFMARRLMETGLSLREIVRRLDQFIDQNGLDLLDPYYKPGRHPGRLARPRRFEIAACLNRLRGSRLSLLQEGSRGPS